MKKHIVGTVTAAILAFLTAGAANAADYTFIVPLAFKELPSNIREVEVVCAVHLGTTGPTFVLLGQGTARRAVTARAVSGELRVEVNRNPGETRRPARWTCSAGLNGQIDGRPQLYLVTGVSAARPTEFRYEPDIPSAPGTPVVIRTTGEMR
jgi:hypothetical protein